ncbi:hypothetical protein CRN84_00085 [Budvicia aquatica]|uniref:ABC transporter permease n=1 Tax=Budvicia aquatica TaxID=82979 RepID=A0A2C6DGG3_9GAMM|nr:hypothetical protein CRN84_00085 [Budvicia aquatica]
MDKPSAQAEGFFYGKFPSNTVFLPIVPLTFNAIFLLLSFIFLNSFIGYKQITNYRIFDSTLSVKNAIVGYLEV